jgi:hypothetical protein
MKFILSTLLVAAAMAINLDSETETAAQSVDPASAWGSY